MSNHTKTTIADLNDKFRRGDPTVPGQFVITSGLNGLLDEHERPTEKLANIVRSYSTFTEDNDPHREHDFGSFEFLDHTCFWKIDVYDKTLKWAAEDATDIDASYRVLTIMLAEEY